MNIRPIDANALKDNFCLNCSTLKRYKRSVEECRANTDVYGNVCFKMRLIDKTPTLDYAPVLHGEWLDGEHVEWTRWMCKCSLCGDEQDFMTNFCPNCGAKMMDGGKKDG